MPLLAKAISFAAPAFWAACRCEDLRERDRLRCGSCECQPDHELREPCDGCEASERSPARRPSELRQLLSARKACEGGGDQQAPLPPLPA